MGATDIVGLSRRLGDLRYLKSPGPAVVGAIGASITNNGTASSYDKVLSGTVAFGYQSPLGTALLRTKGRFAAGGIAATSGFTTAQMVATHLPQVLATSWDYCIVGEATNDLLTGVSIATTRANLTTIINALMAKGIVPILSTTPPNDSYKTGAGLTWLTQLNEWIKARARALRIPVVDYHTALVDPASNGFVASPSYTTDGTHPNAQGCKAMADALVDVLAAIPAHARSPLQGSYNPNLLIPDAVTTSAGSDKMAGSGSLAGGGAYGNGVNTARWKGNAATILRGSTDYLLGWPVSAGAMVSGHRLRLTFGIDVPTGPWVGSGAWSLYLWNLTKSQAIAGYSVMQWPASDGTSVISDDAAITSGSNLITCATRKPFRPSMVGNTVMAISPSGLTARFAAGTTIIGVSADGTQAYCSANANATASAQALVVLGQPQMACFEFDVQSNMVGDSFSFIGSVIGAAGTPLSVTQITLADLTALGAA